MDEVFKALSDPTRLRIIRMLARHGEVCVCKIVDELDMNQPVISHHMAKLKQVGLLNSRKQGQWTHYSLKVEALKEGPLAFLSEMVTLSENARFAVGNDDCCK